MKKFASVVLAVFLLMLVVTPNALVSSGQGDRVVVGEQYVLRSGERLEGDLTVIGGSATLEAGSIVTGDVLLLGGSLAHAGTIEGSLSVFGGSASLDDGSVVEGNVATFGGTLHRAPNAEVRGDLLGGPSMPAMPSVSSRQKGVLSHVGDLLAWEFSTLAWAVLLALLGMVAVAVAPKGMGRIATTAARELPMSFGLGLLTWVVAVLAGLVLLIAWARPARMVGACRFAVSGVVGGRPVDRPTPDAGRQSGTRDVDLGNRSWGLRDHDPVADSMALRGWDSGDGYWVGRVGSGGVVPFRDAAPGARRAIAARLLRRLSR